MKVVNNKITEATREELLEFYRRDAYKEIVDFEVFLEYCRINGTVILPSTGGVKPE